MILPGSLILSDKCILKNLTFVIRIHLCAYVTTLVKFFTWPGWRSITKKAMSFLAYWKRSRHDWTRSHQARKDIAFLVTILKTSQPLICYCRRIENFVYWCYSVFHDDCLLLYQSIAGVTNLFAIAGHFVTYRWASGLHNFLIIHLLWNLLKTKKLFICSNKISKVN